MMHELYQNPTLGYTSALNPGINPLASLGGYAASPAGFTQWGQQGYPGGAIYSQIHPQQLQLAALAAQAAQAAQLYGIQNPLQTAWHQQQLLAQAALQNPYAASILQNILATGGMQNPYGPQQNPFVQQNPYLNPILAQQYGGVYGPQVGGLQHLPHTQYGQIGTPYGQINPALAPQSWVGQGGQLGGQMNPLVQQLAARQFNPGYGGWGI